jgi:hypothetical protein
VLLGKLQLVGSALVEAMRESFENSRRVQHSDVQSKVHVGVLVCIFLPCVPLLLEPGLAHHTTPITHGERFKHNMQPSI